MADRDANARLDPELVRHLEPGEEVHAAARATDAFMAVSNRRLLVAAGERLALSLPIEAVRRIQFDIEKGRPATVVIVPEAAMVEPQVLLIPNEQLEAAALALAAVGIRLAAMPGGWLEGVDR